MHTRLLTPRDNFLGSEFERRNFCSIPLCEISRKMAAIDEEKVVEVPEEKEVSLEQNFVVYLE